MCSVWSKIRRHIGFVWNPVSRLARAYLARALAVLVSRFSSTRGALNGVISIEILWIVNIASNSNEYFNWVMKAAHEECECWNPYELIWTQKMVRPCPRIEARVIHHPCNCEPLSKIFRLSLINIKYQQVHSDKQMSGAGSPSCRPGPGCSNVG